MPFDPDQVLSKLNIWLRTPTPLGSWGSDWEPKTPSNYMQLQKQSSSINALLRMRSRSPPSLLTTAISQILKACQIGMQSATILEKEVGELQAANEKQKQKRTRSKRQIPHEGGLLVKEDVELIEAPIEALIAPAPPGLRQPSPPLQPRTRPPRGCGICRAPGHRRETCPDRPK